MFPGEKRSLYRFLFIYISSTLLLIGIGLGMFYHYDKHRLIDNQGNFLKLQSEGIISKLRELHNSQEIKLVYPQYKEFSSSIYDIDAKYLIGDSQPKTFDKTIEYFQDGEMLFHLKSISPYYLGAAFILVQKPIDFTPVDALKLRLISYFAITVLFVTLFAFWLGRLFLSPIKNSIKLLDDFTRDATHELNTPVSTILANAELLKNFHPELEHSDELRRIETASKRLSRIYDDLAYLRLNHKRDRSIESLNISEFLKERIDYFQSVADAKKIDFTSSIDENVIIDIDKEDMARIIDNLLGNAFKYTRLEGKVEVVLNKSHLSIKDNGLGIDNDAKNKVLERFVRANRSEGGFGLGLSIVAGIAKEYDFDLLLESEQKKGTKVSIVWEK